MREDVAKRAPCSIRSQCSSDRTFGATSSAPPAAKSEAACSAWWTGSASAACPSPRGAATAVSLFDSLLPPCRLFAGPDGMHVYGPIVGTEHVRTILPPVEHHPAGPLPPRPAGLVGIHRSPRAGDSTELRDIRAFQPGDRLKRIDWRVTTRTGRVHVRERHAEADAEIVLAVDTRTDVGTNVADWSSPYYGATARPGGSLDRAVRRAASMAAGYLRQGDRVALMDLSRPQLNVRSGVGRRHLMRIRTQLVVCVQAAGWASRVALRKLPHGSVVVLLSPFLDDEIAELAVQTRKHGHVVLAINTLPLPLRPDPEAPWGEVAAEMIAAEHRLRLKRMIQHGVAVTPEC